MQFQVLRTMALVSFVVALVSASPIPGAGVSAGDVQTRALDADTLGAREPQPGPEPVCRFACF
ncbi:hypothetical protein BD779DRAFT_1667866 [Infundibulicybe gibba]|nr:hypothetical protein BD779DRAFT_1667866 [Infundibulicybe gibba]